MEFLSRLLRVFNANGPRGAVLLAALLLIAALALAGAPLTAALRYERTALANGEWWRVLTAHLVHLDAAHAVVNGAGLVLVWGIVLHELAALRWALIVLAAAVSITAGLWLLYPQVTWYVGASGVLHGMLAAGVLVGVARGDRVSLVALVLLVAKLGYEALAGPLAFTEGKPVVTAAHWLGAAGGAVLALGFVLWDRRQEHGS